MESLGIDAVRVNCDCVTKVIYLSSQNQIIEVIDLFEGTVDSSSVSPREIVEGALKDSAAALIFVHNHPSGNPAPSPSDKQLTRELVYMGKIMRMKVVDHIIIGNDRYYSFADEGLVEEYEMDFLNLKLRGISDAKQRLYHTRISSTGPD
jgi:DNA repair protein RadC